MNEQNGAPELPKGWAWTTVGEIADLIHYGYTESATAENTGTKFLRITDIQNNNVDWESVPFCRIGDEERKKYLLNERDLLFARTGATVGKSFLIRGTIPESIFASYLIRIILNKEVDERFIYNFFQSSNYWRQISENQVGIGRPNVNGTILSTLIIPLPPLNEQARIVAKIEELFTKLDAGIDALRAIRKQIKRYRQAVLRDAVTGELTKAWRAANQADLEPADALLERILTERRARWEKEQLEKFKATGKTPKNDDWKKKYKEPAAPNIENQPELPDGWACATLEAISEKIVDCLHSTAKFTNSGKFCVDTTCIKNGKILYDKIRYVSEETYIERVQRLVPQSGDILFAREGTIGTTVVVPENIELCLGQRMMMFRPVSEIFPTYQMYAMTSQVFENQLKPKISGSTSPHVNIGDLKSMFILFPSLAEQQKIVEEVERPLSVADAMEQTVEQSLKQAERLRQSILKRAFEGRLVPQDERDEPATALLERIKQERVKQSQREKVKVKKNLSVTQTNLFQ
jgi:type I restriction enzyme, S subunit